jgi:protein-S-isoprenylcysteine O-methyltransferase Ste14
VRSGFSLTWWIIAAMPVALRTIIFSILVPGTVALYVPYVLLGRPALQQAINRTSALSWIGIPLLLLGIAIYLRCAWDFTFTGRGTPGPWDPPRAFVATGLYRFVRNPMYVGVLAVIFGEAIWLRSETLVEYGLVVWLFFHLFVIAYEEPTLKHSFGASYDEYRSRVPRWIPMWRTQQVTPRPLS